MQAESLAGLDVLLVEDEALLRRQLAAQLERLGADVTCADTLSAARKKCESFVCQEFWGLSPGAAETFAGLWVLMPNGPKWVVVGDGFEPSKA